MGEQKSYGLKFLLIVHGNYLGCFIETWKLGWDEMIRFDVKDFKNHHSITPIFHHSKDPSVMRGSITRKVVRCSSDSTSIFPPIRLTNRVVM